jgi:hypothetical protein
MLASVLATSRVLMAAQGTCLPVLVDGELRLHVSRPCIGCFPCCPAVGTAAGAQLAEGYYNVPTLTAHDSRGWARAVTQQRWLSSVL